MERSRSCFASLGARKDCCWAWSQKKQEELQEKHSTGSSIQTSQLGPPGQVFPRLTSQPETIRKMRHQLEGKTQEERSRKRKRFLENTVMAHVFLDKPLWSRWQFPKQWPQITRRDWKLSKPLKSRHLKLHPINKLDENFKHLSESSLVRRHRTSQKASRLWPLWWMQDRMQAKKETCPEQGGVCKNGQSWILQDRKWAGGCCGSHKVASWSGIEPTPRRAFGDLKDGTGQRKHSLRFSSHAFPQRGFEEIGPTKERQVSFNLGIIFSFATFGENSMKDSGLPKNHSVLYKLRHSSPSHDRLQKPSVGSGSKDEGEMACRFFGQKVRGSCTPSSTNPIASKPTTGEVPFSTDSVRTAGPKISSPVKPDSKRTLWVVEFFVWLRKFQPNSLQLLVFTPWLMISSLALWTGKQICFVSLLWSPPSKFLKSHRVTLVWLGASCY